MRNNAVLASSRISAEVHRYKSDLGCRQETDENVRYAPGVTGVRLR